MNPCPKTCKAKGSLVDATISHLLHRPLFAAIPRMKPKHGGKATEWEAGVSKVEITPGEPIWLAGWGSRDRPSQGVSQKIYVKSLALKDAADTVAVWVTADLLGYSRDMVEALAQRAKKELGVERPNLILNSSHNHSGPVTDDLLHLYFDLPRREHAVIARYTARLLDRIVESMRLAIDDLAPARLAFGTGLAGFGVNRRRARPGHRALSTVVDPDVPVLSVRSPAGALRAVVFGYACHTTTINDGKVNGDYAGWAQQFIEEMHPDAVALFVAGCGGDIGPMPRFQTGLVEIYGRVLAVTVGQVLAGEMQPVHGLLRAAFAEVALPFGTLPTAKELRARLMQPENVFEKRGLEHQLSIFKREGKLHGSCSFAIQVWRLGSTLKLIALAGEPVVDYSLRFKREYGCEDTWVSGYNDVLLAYIPSLRVLREGGYEGCTGMMEYGLPAPFAPQVEEIIAGAVDELMRETSGTERPWPPPGKHD